MCERTTFFNINNFLIFDIKKYFIKICNITFLSFLSFWLCAFDLTEYVYDIMHPTTQKTDKIQPDMPSIVNDIKNAKSAKLYDSLPKFPTKKTEKIFPTINSKPLKDAVKLSLDINIITDAFVPTKEGFYHQTGLDNFIKDDGKKSDGYSGEPFLGAEAEGASFFKGPAKVPLYGKTPTINKPIEDIANPIGDYLEEVVPLKGLVKPAPIDDIMDYASDQIQDSLDFFEKDSFVDYDNVMDDKFYFLE